MKAYLIADMEGISGVAVRGHVLRGDALYETGCHLMVEDVNAAIEGLAQAGVEDIVVSDWHGSMTNITLEALDPRARLLTGSNRTMTYLDELESSDVVLLVGFHAKSGTELGAFAHSFSSATVDRIHVNGIEMGEVELTALLAGSYGLPIALLTGDETTCRLGREFFGDWLETVAVKRAVSRESCICLHPDVTRPMIRDAARRAIEGIESTHPYILEGPYQLELALCSTRMADQASIYPFAERIDGRTVGVECSSVIELFRTQSALLALAYRSM